MKRSDVLRLKDGMYLEVIGDLILITYTEGGKLDYDAYVSRDEAEEIIKGFQQCIDLLRKES